MTNLMLGHLRHIRTKVDTLDDKVGRVEVRLSAVEGHLGSLLTSESAQNAELDKIGRRLGRIEHRLELSES